MRVLQSSMCKIGFRCCTHISAIIIIISFVVHTHIRDLNISTARSKTNKLNSVSKGRSKPIIRLGHVMV